MPRLERAIAFLLATAGAGAVLAAAGSARAPSGGWQPPQRVVARGAASLAALELDDAGDALAVWQDDASAVYASLRPAASRRWQPAVRLSGRSGTVDGAPAVAVDRAGDVVVAYYVSKRPAERVEVVTGSMRSGRWRSPRSLGGAHGAHGPLLVDVRWIGAGIDAAARATVLFRGPERLSVVSGSARTGNWSRPALLPVATRLAQHSQLAVNEHGAAVVAWTRCEPGTRDVCRTGSAVRFQAIVRSAPRGAWSPPAPIASPGATGSENIASRLVGLTDGGTAVAVWVDGGLWTALRMRSAWQRPLLVTRSIQSGAEWEGQELAFLHADDGALLVWATPRGVLDGRRLDDAGTWVPTGLDRVGAGWGVLAARGPWSVLAWSTESFNAPSSAAVGTDAWQVDPAVGLGDGDLAGAAIDDRGHAVLVWQADATLESAFYDPAG